MEKVASQFLAKSDLTLSREQNDNKRHHLVE